MKMCFGHSIILIILLSFGAYGQKAPRVTATVEPDTIKIGEQAIITLKSQATTSEKVNFPKIADTLSSSIEVLEVSDVDTVTGKDFITYQQKITITSFDSGAYSIPEFTFIIHSKDKTDTLRSSAFPINIQTVIVDTSKAIKDIKPVLSLPAPPPDYSWMWWLLLLIPVGVAIYFIARWLKKKPENILPPPLPKKPAHVKVFEELDKLEKEKVWQKGHYKEYHSRLTRIVRTYLEDRFNIQALEQTSAEVLSMLKKSGMVDQNNYEKLAQLLKLADMVKFAKSHPLPAENEMSIQNARSFVTSTQLEEKPELKA